jgi:hypothetical protein
MVAAATLGAIAALASCKKGSGSDCNAAVGNYMTRIEALIDHEKTSDQERKLAKAGLPGLREQLLASCRDLPWDETARRCVAEAKTADDLEACDPFAGKPASK